MSLDEEETKTLDLCAEKLKGLLAKELAVSEDDEIDIDPEDDPQTYLGHLLRRFSPWEDPQVCK